MIMVGDHVRKVGGFKYIGTVLAVYRASEDGDWYAVVLLDPNEASDSLQHIYKVSQLELD